MDNYNQYQTMSTTVPSASFQSTSTMTASGSSYSSQPTIGSDGVATMGETYTSSQPASGPRRIVTPGAGGIQQPIGDALIPLLLFALAYGAWILTRRKKIDY
ncbi:MAG: hypothetical protein IJ920_00505 [Paludibacteraceae bacterium]|jgi:hypothetical protein|nr:hypothetical protein [Paludibacteraceae bacterium]